MQHIVGDHIRAAVAAVKPLSKDSKFVSEGKLLPDEYLTAGDQLVFKFPSWEWATGKDDQIASYLPREKQYLVTRMVPCKDRVKALDNLQSQMRMEGDWLVPDVPETPAGAANGVASAAAPAGGEIEVEENFLETLAEGGDGLPDFSDLDAAVQASDPATAGGYLVAEAPDDAKLRMRYYDLSITYDLYYQVPRLWLFGYDHNNKPLPPKEIYADVLSEYTEKTVTVDPHPHEKTPTVSIHPCRHSAVMKKVVDDWIAQEIEPRVDLALFVFLKFISGVVPTINYDFTMDIEF